MLEKLTQPRRPRAMLPLHALLALLLLGWFPMQDGEPPTRVPRRGFGEREGLPAATGGAGAAACVPLPFTQPCSSLASPCAHSLRVVDTGRHVAPSRKLGSQRLCLQVGAAIQHEAPVPHPPAAVSPSNLQYS